MMKHVKDVSNFIKISQTRDMPFEENICDNSERETQKRRLVDGLSILRVWIHL